MHVAKDLTPQQIQAYRIADNKTAAWRASSELEALKAAIAVSKAEADMHMAQKRRRCLTIATLLMTSRCLALQGKLSGMPTPWPQSAF